MQEQETICVAYTGEAVNDGTMDINELAPALLALSNLISEANQTLNNDGSKIEVRISSHFERGSFEMILNLIRSLPQQMKLWFSDSGYTLGQVLNNLGLASTLSGVNLLELIRQLKGKQPQKIERVDENTARVIFEERELKVSLGVLKLFKSEKIRRQVEGAVHPLKREGVEGLEFRDANNKEVVAKITTDETEYFSDFSQGEGLEEISSSQRLTLRILNVNFERGLKWRFDDGEDKFYALVKDEKFLEAVETGRISFGYGDTIFAEIETTQQFTGGDLKKTIKSVTKVLRISKQAEQFQFNEEN